MFHWTGRSMLIPKGLKIWNVGLLVEIVLLHVCLTGGVFYVGLHLCRVRRSFRIWAARPCVVRGCAEESIGVGEIAGAEDWAI